MTRADKWFHARPAPKSDSDQQPRHGGTEFKGGCLKPFFKLRASVSRWLNFRPYLPAAVCHRLDLDERVVAAGVVFELALVDAEEEAAVARRVELAVGADGDELVVVVADDGDERPRRLVAHQLLC